MFKSRGDRRKKMLPAEVNSTPAARTAPCPRPPRTRPASHLLTRLIRVSQVNDFARCIKILKCQARAGHGLAIVDKASKSMMARGAFQYAKARRMLSKSP